MSRSTQSDDIKVGSCLRLFRERAELQNRVNALTHKIAEGIIDMSLPQVREFVSKSNRIQVEVEAKAEG